MTFSKRLFDNNDPICRDKILELLGTINIYENTEDIFGIDILINRKDLFYGIELERIYSWTTESVPLSRPRLIQRKYDKYNNKVLFLQFNRDLSKLCIFTKVGVNINDSRTITRGDVSYGTYDKHYEIHKSKNFTFDKLIDFYNRINKTLIKPKTEYCSICKSNVSDLNKHIRRENHIKKTKKLTNDIRENIKNIKIKKHFNDIGLTFEP